jgi:hypothetical protein
MHEEALWAAARLIERAGTLGAVSPYQFLMPFRSAPNHRDSDRPMSNSGIKKAWDQVRKAADLPWLRIHDLRHTITRMAEAGVPIPVILSMAGHISKRMQQHYTSVSEFARRRAVEAAFGAGNYMVSAGRLMGSKMPPLHKTRTAQREAPQTEYSTCSAKTSDPSELPALAGGAAACVAAAAFFAFDILKSGAGLSAQHRPASYRRRF